MAPPWPRPPLARALLAAAALAGGRAAPEAPVATEPAAPAGAAVQLLPQGNGQGSAAVKEGASKGPPTAATEAPDARDQEAAPEGIVGSKLPSTGVMEYLCSQQDDLANSVKSPVGVYLHHLDEGFHDYPHQSAVAAIALVMGCLCVWNGPRTWQALFTATMVGAATSLARIEAESWHLDMVSELLLMFQAAFATGVAIQSGFDGFQVLFGTGVGFLGCYGCGGWARGLDHLVPGFALLWYSLGAMFGALVLTVWQQPVLVTLGPLVGGFLVSSSTECLFARLLRASGGADAQGSSLLPPLDSPWVDVATELLFLVGPGALAAFGGCALLATLVYKSGSGDERRPHAVLCLVACTLVSAAVAAFKGSQWRMGACALWAVITAVSSYYQLGMLQNWRAKTLAEVAETFSNAGSQYFRTPLGSGYEPVGSFRDLEGARGLNLER